MSAPVEDSQVDAEVTSHGERERKSSRDRERKKSRRSRSRSRSRSRRRKHSRRRRSRSRDRDRKRHKRSRRSRSRGRHRSRSRSRSRHRSRRRDSRSPKRDEDSSRKERKSRFGAPPPGFVKSSTGITMPSKEAIQALLASQQGSGNSASAANPQITRQARRVYVGNLPVGMGLNEKMLQDFFATTVMNLGISTPNPVLSAWLSSEGTFAFVEFRSVKDTTTALTLLDGVSLGGRVLRIGRPADYSPPPPDLSDYMVGMSAAEIAASQGNGIAPVNAAAMMQNQGSMPMPGMPSLVHPSLHAIPPAPTSEVVVLSNLILPADLIDDEDYLDILEDMKEECGKHGEVVSLVVPRPEKLIQTKREKGPENVRIELEPGVGKVFIQYKDSTQSQAALEALHGRSFNDNTVIASYFPKEKFEKGDFTDGNE